MPPIVIVLVVLEPILLGQLRRQPPRNRHQLHDRRYLKVHVAVLHAQQRPPELGPVRDLDRVHDVVLAGGRLTVVQQLRRTRVERVPQRFVVVVEGHIGDALVARVQILAGRVLGALLQLAELNLLAELALVAARAGAAVMGEEKKLDLGKSACNL